MPFGEPPLSVRLYALSCLFEAQIAVVTWKTCTLVRGLLHYITQHLVSIWDNRRPSVDDSPTWQDRNRNQNGEHGPFWVKGRAKLCWIPASRLGQLSVHVTVSLAVYSNSQVLMALTLTGRVRDHYHITILNSWSVSNTQPLGNTGFRWIADA